MSFGVYCNYDCKYSDLQLSIDGVANIETLQIMPFSLKQTVPSIIAPALRLQATGSQESRNAIYDFRGQDLELLNRFQTRTVFTITTDKNLHVYQKETFKLAYSVRNPSTYLANPTDSYGSAPFLDAFDTVVDTYA